MRLGLLNLQSDAAKNRLQFWALDSEPLNARSRDLNCERMRLTSRRSGGGVFVELGVVGHVAALPIVAGKLGLSSRHWEVLSGTGACLQDRCRPDHQPGRPVKGCQEGGERALEQANANAHLLRGSHAIELLASVQWRLRRSKGFSPLSLDRISRELGGKSTLELIDTI